MSTYLGSFNNMMLLLWLYKLHFTCGEEFKGLLGLWAPASPQRVSSLTNGAQDDETEEESIKVAPVRLHGTDQEGREEEKEGEDERQEEANVDKGCPGVGQTPVIVQDVDRSVGDDTQEEAGEESEEEQGEGDPHGAVEDAEEFGLV